MFTIILQSEGVEPKYLDFDKPEVTVGRLSSSDIPLKVSNVSKQHSRIVFREGRHFVIDRKSTNGTFVNGKRVSAPKSLKSGDKIYVGDFSLTFLLADDQAKPKDASQPAVDAATEAKPVPPPLPSSSDVTPQEDEQPAEAAEATPEPMDEAASMPPLPGEPMELIPDPIEDEDEPARQTIEQQAEVTDLDLFAEARYQIFRDALDLDEFGDEDLFLTYRLDNQELVDAVKEKLEGLIAETLDEQTSDEKKDILRETIIEELLGFGPIEQYLFEEDVEEIFINGPDSIVLFRNGVKEVAGESFSCEESLFYILSRILHSAGIHVEEEHGIFDIQTPDGFGVSGVLYPFSVKGTALRITKPVSAGASVDSLLVEESIDQDIADALREAMVSNKTVAIVGLNDGDRLDLLTAIASEIPLRARLALLNAGRGLALPHEDQLTLEGGAGEFLDADLEIGTAELLQHLPRLNVDRIVALDVREDAAMELLFALNGGMAGSIFSVFGSSAEDGLKRFERMALAYAGDDAHRLAKELIGANVDLVAVVKRFANSKRRLVSLAEVSEADGNWKLTERFRFDVKTDTADKLEGEFVKL